MSDPQHFLVQSKSNSEQHARDALTASYRGCTVYLPLVLEVVIHARRRKTVERAFLPRYLFVLDEGQGLPVINACPGVSHVVRNAGGVLMVAQRWVDLIKARETDGEFENHKGETRAGRYVDLGNKFMPLMRDQYKPGEIVRVSDGPFAWFNGLFEKWTRPDQRAAIAVNIFGRMTPVELERGQFEKL